MGRATRREGEHVRSEARGKRTTQRQGDREAPSITGPWAVVTTASRVRDVSSWARCLALPERARKISR